MYLVVHVVPKSRRCAYTYDTAGRLKIYLKSAPEQGAANAELITLLAQWLDLPKSSISIASGFTTRTKRLAIQTSMSMEQILEKLGFAVQKELF